MILNGSGLATPRLMIAILESYQNKDGKVNVPDLIKPYFGKDAHLAIIEYQNEPVRCEKNKIYVKKIKPSFEKLVENLIFIHGFSSSAEGFKILKSDCVSFLFEILEKFDSSKGSKAFSYFNVCAKNFLIIQNKKKNKNRIKHISIDDDSLSIREKNQIELSQVIPSQEDVVIYNEDKQFLKEMLKKIKEKSNNKNEEMCAKAIITLFENINELDFLNKRAVFVYLRELSGLNTKQLSVAMSNIRKYYKDVTFNNTEFFLFKSDFI